MTDSLNRFSPPRPPGPKRPRVGLLERPHGSLAYEEAGEGRAVVLLHGLTATHRYVLHGSRALERSGHRVIAYDARGHGGSSPAAHPTAYTYDQLGQDLVAVLDALGIERAVLAGVSMGAHTALWLTLHHPDRVGGLVVITPGYDPDTQEDQARLRRWDALAEGLRSGGVEGFLAAYGEPTVPARWREAVISAIRQRLARHQHPRAVADALQVVPRSRPFGAVRELERIAVPTTVIGSRDETDPGHPLALAQDYREAIPGSRLVCEQPDQSPLAWQGSRVSKLIAEVADEAG